MRLRLLGSRRLVVQKHEDIFLENPTIFTRSLNFCDIDNTTGAPLCVYSEEYHGDGVVCNEIPFRLVLSHVRISIFFR